MEFALALSSFVFAIARRFQFIYFRSRFCPLSARSRTLLHPDACLPPPLAIFDTQAHVELQMAASHFWPLLVAAHRNRINTNQFCRIGGSGEVVGIRGPQGGVNTLGRNPLSLSRPPLCPSVSLCLFCVSWCFRALSASVSVSPSAAASPAVAVRVWLCCRCLCVADWCCVPCCAVSAAAACWKFQQSRHARVIFTRVCLHVHREMTICSRIFHQEHAKAKVTPHCKMLSQSSWCVCWPFCWPSFRKWQQRRGFAPPSLLSIIARVEVAVDVSSSLPFRPGVRTALKVNISTPWQNKNKTSRRCG